MPPLAYAALLLTLGAFPAHAQNGPRTSEGTDGGTENSATSVLPGATTVGGLGGALGLTIDQNQALAPRIGHEVNQEGFGEGGGNWPQNPAVINAGVSLMTDLLRLGQAGGTV